MTPRRRGKIPVIVTGVFPASFFVRKSPASDIVLVQDIICRVQEQREATLRYVRKFQNNKNTIFLVSAGK